MRARAILETDGIYVIMRALTPIGRIAPAAVASATRRLHAQGSCNLRYVCADFEGIVRFAVQPSKGLRGTQRPCGRGLRRVKSLRKPKVRGRPDVQGTSAGRECSRPDSARTACLWTEEGLVVNGTAEYH